MADPRFLAGDEVFVHAGPLAGATGRLQSADERTRSGRFSGERAGKPVRDSVRYEQLCLASPPRRPVEDDARVALRLGLLQRVRDDVRLPWLRQAATGHGAPDDRAMVALLAQVRAAEQSQQGDVDQACARALTDLDEAWRGLDRPARLARWRLEYTTLIPGPRSPAELARLVMPAENLANLERYAATPGAPSLDEQLTTLGQQYQRESYELERSAPAAETRVQRVRATPPRFQHAPPLAPDVALPDDALARAFRRALDRPEGPLTPHDLASIDRLVLTAHHLRDLTPLRQCTRLRSLQLDSLAPLDLSPLAALTSLRSLILRAPRATGHEALRHLSSLHALALVEAPPSAFACLARLPALTELAFTRSPLVDLSPLTTLPRLTFLALSSTAIDDLGPVSALAALDELRIEQTNARDLTPLASLGALETLWIEGCPLTTLAPLQACRALRRVQLGPSAADGVEPLQRRGVAVDTAPLADARELLADDPGDGPARLARIAELAKPQDAVANFPRTEALRLVTFRDGDDATLRAATHQLVEKLAFRGEVTLRGLVLRDGRLPLPFAPNPFGLPAHPELLDAIRNLWTPLRLRAPSFLASLLDATLGLALYEVNGEMSLAYLHLMQEDRCELHRRGLALVPPAPEGLERLGDWAGRGSLGALLGAAPRHDLPERVEVDGLPDPVVLPTALRELYAVHGGFSNFTSLWPPDNLLSVLRYREEQIDRLVKRTERSAPWHLLQFSDDGSGNGHALDLDALDGRGDPLVRAWEKTWEAGTEAQTFWDWFEQEAPGNWLGRPRDENWIYWGARFR